MTTGPVAQPADVRRERDEPEDGTEDKPSASDDRAVAVTATALVLLLVLAVRTFVILNRSRSENNGKTSPPVPHSKIRIAAAPHSVVHVVSAPCLGRSHVQVPTRITSPPPTVVRRTSALRNRLLERRIPSNK